MRLIKKSNHLLTTNFNNKAINIVTQEEVDKLRKDKMYYDTFIRRPIEEYLENNKKIEYIVIAGKYIKHTYFLLDDSEKFLHILKELRIDNDEVLNIME
ncbi:hypothetical protein [Clostridium sardiniense]|uniref:hypothetical protein n=1 Tax=Clostridium sardiniense TaxID=29369 RepID=UPI001958C7CB|nr:hypothetical protein [Clostridium sardiniense]MBM7836312.1 hypothetical protein [Clostridium sardiniense]